MIRIDIILAAQHNGNGISTCYTFHKRQHLSVLLQVQHVLGELLQVGVAVAHCVRGGAGHNRHAAAGAVHSPPAVSANCGQRREQGLRLVPIPKAKDS